MGVNLNSKGIPFTCSKERIYGKFREGTTCKREHWWAWLCLQVKSNHFRCTKQPCSQTQFQRRDLTSLRSSNKAVGSVTPTQHPTELMVYKSSPLLEKVTMHTCHQCSSATRIIWVELQKPFCKLQSQSSLGSLGMLVRAVASFGTSTEDDSSGLRNSSLPEMPCCQQGEQWQLLFAASFQPTQLQRVCTVPKTTTTTCSIPLPPSALSLTLQWRADLWTPAKCIPLQAGLGFIYHRRRKADSVLF